MAGARHRGRAAARRRDRPEVADSPEGLREAYPGLAREMGERTTRPHLAGAARRHRAAMAQTLLWRGQAHGGRADARTARSEACARQPGRDPLGQFDRARADDDGRDAGAVSGGPGFAGLFADEPRPRQAEIPVRPDQAQGRDGAGRPGLREGVEGASARRRHRHPCRAALRRHRERRVRRACGDAGDKRRRGFDRRDHAGNGGKTAVHLGLDRHAQGRHQHAGNDVRQCRDDDAGAAARAATRRRRPFSTGCRGTTPWAATRCSIRC